MKQSLIPNQNWNPKSAADAVMENLVTVSGPEVKGAHDSDFLIVDDKAHLLYMANDVKPGESPRWPFVYSAYSRVELGSMKVERIETMASSEMEFSNHQLPVGACFVPRLARLNTTTLRCFFSCEAPTPEDEESKTWYTDFDLAAERFSNEIHQPIMHTRLGSAPMRPGHFYQQAVAEGFTGDQVNFGLYMIDGFKSFGGQYHSVLNGFGGCHMGWGRWNDPLTEVTVLGNYFKPLEAHMTEASVEQLPDGTWLATCRRNNGDKNYLFTESPDGRHWSQAEPHPQVANGMSSKSTLNRFGECYYHGWQEATRIHGVGRSVFNIDVSRNGREWHRKYRFETDRSFQYPTFRQYEDSIYLSVTQGEAGVGGKTHIRFGLLETLGLT